ncbi:MAG: collagen-like protein, partial [Eubacteriaceae bacterium]|nr:collagen-like protein [Eubacteriaceae bacterium]
MADFTADDLNFLKVQILGTEIDDEGFINTGNRLNQTVLRTDEKIITRALNLLSDDLRNANTAITAFAGRLTTLAGDEMHGERYIYETFGTNLAQVVYMLNTKIVEMEESISEVTTISGDVGETGPQGPKGDTGEKGDVGAGFNLKGISSSNELLATYPTGAAGDAFLTDSGELFVWAEKSASWASAGNIKGPVGPAGPAGKDGTGVDIKGEFPSYEQLYSDNPKGHDGDAYLIAGDLYVWAANESDWVNVGRIQGPAGPAGPKGSTGPAGKDGTGVDIKGESDSYESLAAEYPTGQDGDAYLVNGDLYVWAANENDWVNVGRIQGPAGPAGAKGATGAKGADGASFSLNSIASYSDLIEHYPAGSAGEAFITDAGELYAWSAADGMWASAGSILGPKGDAGPVGPRGPAGPAGKDGTGVDIKGESDSYESLAAEHPTGQEGDAYLINGDLYVWA